MSMSISKKINSLNAIASNGITAHTISGIQPLVISSSGSGGISPSGSAGQHLQWGSQGLHWSEEKHSHELYKKYEIYELSEDLLVLSCCEKRLRDAKSLIHSDFVMSDHGNQSLLLNSKLFKNISAEDRDLADKIRDHYSKKIMMLKLKEIKLSGFRETLNSFIHSDGMKVKQEVFPLVYKLPEFYEYDVGFQAMLDEHDHTTQIDAKYHASKNQHTLIPVKKLLKRTKHNKSSEYWFIDKDTSNLLLISVTAKNELETVIDWLFKNNSLFKIEGKTFIKTVDQTEYLSITNWELLNI